MQDTRNPRLRENVLLGIIAPSRLAVMTPQEMASDEMKELRAKLTKEAIDDHQMAKREGAKSDLFQCDRCEQRNTTYNQVTSYTTHAHARKHAQFQRCQLGLVSCTGDFPSAFIQFVLCLRTN